VIYPNKLATICKIHPPEFILRIATT
jgi:hypothetical protein